LSVGRDEERGRPSLDINPGNLQPTAAGLRQRRADEDEHADECRKELTCHVRVSIEDVESWTTSWMTTGEYLSVRTRRHAFRRQQRHRDE